MIVVVELYVAGRFIIKLGPNWCSTEYVTVIVMGGPVHQEVDY